jgi:hypothetical protein
MFNNLVTMQAHTRGLNTIHFHSNAQLLLTGGQDKSLKLFQVGQLASHSSALSLSLSLSIAIISV